MSKNTMSKMFDITLILILLIIAVGIKFYMENNTKEDTVKPPSSIITTKKPQRNIGEEAIKARKIADGTYTSTNEEDVSNIIETESEKKYLLARLVYAEARGMSDEHQQAVASVVLNRMNSNKFPNSIDEVIYQRNPLQYACIENGAIDKVPDEQSVKNAYYVWDNGSTIPENVLFQAEFMQGSGLYKKIGNTYFCYEWFNIEG